MVYAPTWSMEHEAPLNCSSQIIHTYIHAYIRVPKRDRNRNFPAKYVLNRIFSHLGPGQVLFKIHFKFSCSHLLYYPGGSTLHTHTNYTCLSYIYTPPKRLWSCPMQALSSSSIKQGDLLYIV